MEFTSNENLYKEVLRTMSECVIIQEKSGKIVALNENVEKVLGIKSELLTESMMMQFEFVKEDGSSLPYSELPVVNTLNQGIPFQDFIIGVSDRNRDMKWLSINSTPIKIQEYGEQAALVTISDITERKKMEHAIIQAKEEAEKANLAKSDFLSKMSHELRTPLNGILGFAQLLEMDKSLNDEQRDFVHEILLGGGHLLNLINDILDLSRIETGKLKVSIEEIDILNIINECINIVQPLANKKNISIHKQLDQSQNTFVLADPIRLKQILFNLLDNAIKYNRESGKVKITCHMEGDEQVIHIVDTGEGLSVEEYHKVFVPFYRIEGTQEEGTGIGLSLVKQLVQLMGGKISVTSKKGKGSDFCLRLPLPHELKAAVQWGEKVESPQAKGGRVDHYHLLYIEDNESNLHFVHSIIKSQPSFSLLVARTGKEGLEMAKTEKVDLILLDLNLPDIHGYEVFEILKSGAKTKDIAIIAISANAMPQDIQQTLEKGFINYVTKPFNVKEFMSIIRETLNSTINQNIPDNKILSTGPHGEEAVSAKTLQLSWKDLNKLKEHKFKVAIAMHITGNEWSRSVIEGLKTTFGKMGTEILAVTDAQFNWEKQVTDIESILAKKPDIIVSVPVDPVFTAKAFQKAVQAGVKLVFMDNTPKGLQPGKDYLSVVSADNYGNGVEAALIMVEKLGGVGQIGVIYHESDFFATKQRLKAFEITINEKFPDIQIVARSGFTSPNEGEKVAAAMLTNHPDLNGIFVVWDILAEGAIVAALAIDRDDLVITTIDLGANVALEMAKDGLIKGLGAQMPFHQGVAEALLAGYALLGKQAPPYVAVPAQKVTKENLLDAWKLVYNEEAPDAIQKCFKNQPKV
ncbi:substrate-binding domain-containing protein [Bacillus sp. AFS031507]|uniref:substrate-binding domain-containing protein n=1 Tax=Bacillus sp. AFS031507 TaxID=2033496 RepID=UPI000BFCC2F3|nr:substrate-binding domain-containing protein [Bacillus sp. AFS031507]PGY11939.1 histidine kinase [Bacillus sp. AFS031507]